MKAISIILLIVFVTTSVVVVPVSALRDHNSVTVDEDGVLRLGDDPKRPDRPKPPPPDEGKRPPREKPDPPSDEGKREDRERGKPPVYDDDYRDEDYVEPITWPTPIPRPMHCHCGRLHCQVHDYVVRSSGYGSQAEPWVGLYGLAATTVMILNLVYSADYESSHDALGATGIVLGVTGVVWSLNANDPWNQRTLFLAGLLTVGISLAQIASGSPDSDTTEYRRTTPAASVSFSF